MLIEINTQSPSPIYEQLRNQIVMGLASGRLARGEALPSVRSLAADLGVNFHTVAKAYALLANEGYIVMNRRKGAVVSEPLAGDAGFRAKLAGQLVLTAAEAVCHKISEREFIEFCADCYRQAQYHPEKGESK